MGISDDVFLDLIAKSLNAVISIINYYRENDKFFKDLFTEFNKRYNDPDDCLNSIKQNEALDGIKRQKISDYTDLRAEEYMWMRKGRIQQNIWASWKNGMRVYQQNLAINKVFEEEMGEWKSSYYGFFDHID